MKSILYVIALLAIAGAAFFSFTNKDKFQDQQDARLAIISTNKTVAAKADATQTGLNSEKEKLVQAKSDKADVEQSLANLQSKERGLRRELSEVETMLEEQKVKLDELDVAMAKVNEILESLGLDSNITPDTIAGSIKDLQDDKKELVAEMAELETNITGATNAVAANREKIARLASRKALRDSRIRANALESVVTAVDQDWGFVVIGAGSNTGFRPRTNSTLIVKRDGRMIAEVKPSSIEASQTIAEIDRETLAPGVRLQPGDRVILSEPAAN